MASSTVPETSVLLLSNTTDEVHHVGDASLFRAMDLESLRAWSLPTESLGVSFTFGDGTRAHGVLKAVGGRESGRVAVVSRRPAFGFLRKALDAVTRAALEGSALDARAAAERAVDKQAKMPLVEDDAEVGAALGRLSGEALVTAWAAMLLEARVVIRAKSSAKLAPLAAALVSCLEPLTYSHVFAPVLPSPEAVEVLAAPVPFVVGVSASDRAAWRAQRTTSVAASFCEEDDDPGFAASDSDNDDENYDEGFDEATRQDGVVIVDADAGAAKLPAAFRATLDAVAGPRFWDALARKVGRRLRDDGPAQAVRCLRAETAALLAPQRQGSQVVGRLEWRDGLSSSSEFDGLALWIYDGGAPALWVPVDAMESVSPLGDRRFELAATEKACFCAFSDDDDAGSSLTKKRRRFVLASPTPADARQWTAALEAAINAARKRRPPAATPTALLRDAVVRTQSARLALRRHFEGRVKDDKTAKAPPLEEEEDTAAATTTRRRSFDDVVSHKTKQFTEVLGRLLSTSFSSEEEHSTRRRSLDDDVFAADEFFRDSEETKLEEDTTALDTPTSKPSLRSSAVDTPPPADARREQMCRVLRLALDGSPETSGEEVATTFSERPSMGTPPPPHHRSSSVTPPPVSGNNRRRPPLELLEERTSGTTLSSNEDDPFATHRDVILDRPRMITLFPADDDTIASSNALNAAAWLTQKGKAEDDVRSSDGALRRLIDDSASSEEGVVPRSPAVSPNDVVVALLDRFVALVQLQPSSDALFATPLSPRRDSEPQESRLEACLEGVRATTGFEAFEEASALLWRVSLDSLAYDEDDDGLEHDLPKQRKKTSPTISKKDAAVPLLDRDADEDSEASRLAFWINIHNLSVLHACVAKGAPPVSRGGTSGVVRYYAWSRAQKYAVGGLLLSIFQIEHSILRAEDRRETTTWTGWLADLARFGRSDPRRLLVPRSPPAPELSFALFAATRSSAPLTVFRAKTKRGLDAELKAHAARSLARQVQCKGPGFDDTDAFVGGDVDPLRKPTDEARPLRKQSSTSSSRSSGAVVVLPAAMRWHQRCWGRSSADVLATVHRLLADHRNDVRLANALVPSSSSIGKSSPNKLRPGLKVEYQAYDWSPGLTLDDTILPPSSSSSSS